MPASPDAAPAAADTASPGQALAELRDGEIHVWLARTGAVDGEDGGLPASALLDARELERASRLRLARDRQRFVAAHALLRTTLSRYVRKAPSAWVFGAHRHGKPCVVDADADARALQFNLSHSQDMVALALAFNRPVGVDIECMGRAGVDTGLVAESFADAERADLETLEPAARRLAAFRLWTLKEAFAKALGADLAAALPGLCFELPQAGRIGVRLDPGLGTCTDEWAAWQWHCGADLLVAACVRDGAAGPARATRCRLRALTRGVGEGLRAGAEVDARAAWSSRAGRA